MSTANITPPGIERQRRMSSPVPPPAPLDLPEPSSHAIAQPSPSPLRNRVTMDPVTGTLSEDGSPDLTGDIDPWGTRDREQMNQSPSPSITKLASSFAQRVGSLVSSVGSGSQSGYLPTEAELEAEAEFQRDKSRREAERILTQEAVERKKVEERVLEMLEASRAHPTRAQTTPSPGDPPSPTLSDKGAGWWSVAKSKLTPMKDKELTPAQQIVIDTKAREKEKRKSKDKEWPSNGKSKYHDPAYQSLSLPPGARPPGGMVGGGAHVISGSPGSPSPHSSRPVRQLMSSPSPSPSRTPDHSPVRSQCNNDMGPGHLPQPGMSPALSVTSSRDPAPLYAQFSSQGALDVPATLLTIAQRFEKLERWAVGHVRALEERMSDVEKWLVDKEREREKDAASSKLSPDTQSDTISPKTGEKDTPIRQVVREITIERQMVEIDKEVKREVSEMKEELGELRGRVGVLGREMAQLASNCSNDVSHDVFPSETSGFGIERIVSPETTNPNTPVTPSLGTLPSIPANQDGPQSPSAHSIAQSESASIISTSTATRTKLPYPTGDYTSPSPPGSPRPSTTQSIGNYTANNASSNISRTRPMSYSGLPIPQTNFSSSVGLPQSSGAGDSTSGSPSLPPPSRTRPLSTSSPRKRYTVALGQPLLSSPSSSSAAPKAAAGELHPLVLDQKKADFGDALFSEPQPLELQTAFFSRALGESDTEGEDIPSQPQEEITKDDGRGIEDTALHRQETIGKTPITLSRLSLSPPPSQNSSPNNAGRITNGLQRSSPRPSSSSTRVRAHSTYGVPGSSASSVSLLSRPGYGSISPSPDEREGASDGKGSLKTRSRSIDRVGLGIDAGHGVSNFVDPLVIRKKERERGRGVTTRSPVVGSPGGPKGRVAFGDLLAFFDGEKQ